MPNTTTIQPGAKRSGFIPPKLPKSKSIDAISTDNESADTEEERSITVLVRISSRELNTLFQAGLAGARIAKNMREITLAEAKRIIEGK